MNNPLIMEYYYYLTTIWNNQGHVVTSQQLSWKNEEKYYFTTWKMLLDKQIKKNFIKIQTTRYYLTLEFFTYNRMSSWKNTHQKSDSGLQVYQFHTKFLSQLSSIIQFNYVSK